MDSEDFFSKLNDNLMTKPVDELKVEQFSSDVISGKIKFLTVIESLKDILTDENIKIREKGIEFLSWLLSKLPKSMFNYSEINVLSTFYCECIKGHHNLVSPTIKGLLELVKMEQMVKENLLSILVNFFQHINCQSQLQPDRVLIYTLLKYVVENHLDNVKQMGPDFVFGIISLIEGEADPFCLMIIFNFMPLLIKNFDLGHLSEELFELLSCYFPIDFNPSSNEEIKITREDLSEGLHHCLSANQSFSEQSIGLILEKANSTFKNAKLDSYKLLKECCKTIKVEKLEEHLNPLWKCLSKDILPGNDQMVSDAGLVALSEIVGLLSKDESCKKLLFTFMEDILMTVKSLASRVDENMFQPAIRVLVAVSSKSKPATSVVLDYLKTFSQLKLNNSFVEKKILSSFLPFLSICTKYKAMYSEDCEQSYLTLVNLYLDASISADYETRKLAFLGLSEIILDCTPEFRKRLCDIILMNIRTKEDIKTSEELIKVWRNLSSHYSDEISKFIAEELVVKDTDSFFRNYCWALSIIADLPTHTGFVIPFFIRYIHNYQFYAVALKSLLNSCKIAKANECTSFFHAVHSEHNVIEKLMQWCLNFKPVENLEEKSLYSVSQIIAILTRYQNLASQQSLVDKVTKKFIEETIYVNGTDFSDTNLTRNVCIAEAVLGSVRPEVKIQELDALRETLISCALNATNENVRLSASRLLSILVNKLEDTLSLKLLNVISKNVFEHLEDDCDIRLKINASFLFTWTVKGVVLRGGHSFDDWTSTWFTLLGRTDIGEVIAEGFRTVLEESDLYLNLDSHCIVRVLYRQRLFQCLPKIIKMFEMSDWSVKMNYLLALVRLLEGVPTHLIQMEISNIIAILSQCLDADKPEILLTTLEILANLLVIRDNAFSDYVQSFVPKFLKLARFESLMKIRIKALQCLYFYGFYPTFILLPIKNQVIQKLELCLDDKKRLVRKEAVRARCRWFLVGAPGEDILNS